VIPTGDDGFYSITNSVSIKKPCQGVVVGQFVTEMGQSDTGSGFLVGLMLATCMGSGGYSNPCVKDSEVLASPGEMVLDGDVQPEVETRSMNAVWPSLKRGVWKFEMLVRGDGAIAAIGAGTFHVEAFTGGPSA
jgi:hypothetical protein